MKSILFRTTLIAAAAALLSTAAFAQTGAKLKVGLMLPYTGTYASLGNAIENGFKLYLTEQGGKIGGREIEFVMYNRCVFKWNFVKTRGFGH